MPQNSNKSCPIQVLHALTFDANDDEKYDDDGDNDEKYDDECDDDDKDDDES